jgi:hypothetical protein
MTCTGNFVRCAAAAVAVSSMPSGAALAQSGSANLRANFDQRFDCERPFKVRNHPIRSEFKATLNADKTATATLAITGIIFTNTVRFDARLGGGAQSAPGGTSALRVLPGNRLQGVWDLPNNQLILEIASRGSSCTAKLNFRLKPGKKEYSLYDGRTMFYCTKHQLLASTCVAE